MNFKAEKTENANEMKLEFTVDAKIFEEGIQKVFKKSAQYFNNIKTTVKLTSLQSTHNALICMSLVNWLDIPITPT